MNAPGSPRLVKLLSNPQAMDAACTSSIHKEQQNTPPLCKLEPGAEQVTCARCSHGISDRFLLKSMDKYWHEHCLKCECCQCVLAENGSTLYYKNKMIMCRRDYLRLFGATGMCAACNKQIPAFEMVMRARGNVYHLECFACQECTHRFCVGDKFYLCDNKILCQYDYEERKVFAQMAYNFNSLAQMKRRIQQVDDFDEVHGPGPVVATR